MRVVTITGDHPRHAYLVARVADCGLLAGAVVERREAFVPSPPADLPARLAALHTLHFERRAEAERRFFGAASVEAAREGAVGGTVDAALFGVAAERLNDGATIGFLQALAPDLILSYGCHKLAPAVLACAGRYAWNVHGGLSPDYRGVATHFWPSYMLEPQMTGMTLHQTTDRLDGGAILHQTAAPMVRGDGLHDLAARAVKGFADDLPDLLRRVAAAAEPVAGCEQRGAGRLWTAGMWRPDHLVPIYEQFEDRLVDRVLDGEIAGRVPALVTLDDAAG